jgi:hypothetical protein
MARKALKVDITPGADPERKSFPFDPVVYARQRRKELLEAAFSIMVGFRQAGMPEFGLPAVGSFGDWERKVRNLVYWLTDVDVAEGFRLNKIEDPLRQKDAELMRALYTHFRVDEKTAKSYRFTSADVMRVYKQVKFDNDKTRSARGVLDALDEVFGEKKLDAKTFGYWPSRMNDRHCGPFILSQGMDTRTNAKASVITCPDADERAAITKTIKERQSETAEATAAAKIAADRAAFDKLVNDAMTRRAEEEAAKRTAGRTDDLSA